MMTAWFITGNLKHEKKRWPKPSAVHPCTDALTHVFFFSDPCAGVYSSRTTPLCTQTSNFILKHTPFRPISIFTNQTRPPTFLISRTTPIVTSNVLYAPSLLVYYLKSHSARNQTELTFKSPITYPWGVHIRTH